MSLELLYCFINLFISCLDDALNASNEVDFLATRNISSQRIKDL